MTPDSLQPVAYLYVLAEFGTSTDWEQMPAGSTMNRKLNLLNPNTPVHMEIISGMVPRGLAISTAAAPKRAQQLF